jgi:hypothetical protein
MDARLFSYVEKVSVSIHFDPASYVFVEEIAETINDSVMKKFEVTDKSDSGLVQLFSSSLVDKFNQFERVIDFVITVEHYNPSSGHNTVKSISKGIVGGARTGGIE